MTLLRRYEELLDRLLVEMKEHYGPRLVACAVFGSVGRGTPRYESDIDLLIVARDLPRGRLNRVEEFLPVEARLEPALKAPEPGGGFHRALARLQDSRGGRGRKPSLP